MSRIIPTFVLMVLGVTPQTTTLKDEEQVDSNLPYTFVWLGGLEQVPLEHSTPEYQVRPS